MTSEELQKLLDEATPGPWWCGVPDDFSDIPIQHEGEALVIATASNGDAKHYMGRGDEHEANARLIAAAPDLAAELIRVRQERDELRNALEKYAQTNGVGDTRITCFDCYDNSAAARAARAKWGA